MANKKISELQSRTPSLSDLLLVGDPSSGYSYKCTVTALATIIETDIADGYVTIGTTQTISGAKTFSNNLTLTSVSNANTDTDKFLVLNASNIVNFRTGAEVLSDIGGQGALTLTTTGSSGASTLVGNTLNIPTYTLSGLGGISGSGSTGYLPKFTGTTSIGNSIVQDNGSTLNIAGGIICNAISASSLTSDQYIAFQNINTSYSLSGYTMLYATLTNPGFIFNFGDGTRSAIFRYAAGSYTYTLPSATGTLALTSDITNSVSGTIGFIAKFTGTGSVGISQIYESGTSIGIGTTSPSGKTEISGSASGSTFVALNLRNIDEVVGSDASMYFSTGSGALASTNITGLIRSSVTQANPSALKGNLKFYVNSGDNIIEGMQLDASGNLGIGTTSPSQKLVVQESGDVFLQLRNNTAGQNFFIGALSTETRLNNDNTTPTTFWNNGSERMRITSSGNVGIGTTSPAQLLHIQGSGTTYLHIGNSQTGSTSSDGFDIGYFSGETGLNIIQRENDYIAISTNNAERMRITSGGNVGIGTTSPATALEVAGSVRAYLNSATSTELFAENNTVKVRLIAGTSSSFLSTTTNHPLIFETNNTERMRITSTGNVRIVGGGDFEIYPASGSSYTALYNDNDNFSIWNNGSERMRITSAGNVGIGTTSPSYKLQVQGPVPVNEAISDIIMITDNASNSGYLGIARSSSTQNGLALSSDGKLVFRVGSTTEAMTIRSTGNVGIGTSSPNSYTNYTFLTINNAVTGSGLDLDVNDTRTATFNTTASLADIGTVTNIPFAFYTNGSERMRITSGGNVGIGTTTPGSKLSVVGLPTSSTGLSAGDIWNDSGTLKIV